MEEQSLGAVDITVDVIGHDVASYMLILKLPTGAIIPATVSRANFNKHIVPLFENPPEKVVRHERQVHPAAQAAIQEAVQEAKEEVEDDSWWDIDQMFQEIRWHAKDNGRSVVVEDRNVQPPRLAFRCTSTDKTWSVDMKYMYEFIDRLSASPKPEAQSRGFQLRKCVSTGEGKKRLAESLNNAIQ